jgi:hypothetical protein
LPQILSCDVVVITNIFFLHACRRCKNVGLVVPVARLMAA